MSDLSRVFSQAARLPQLPEVVLELDRLTRSDSSDTRQIAAVIAKDQVVAAKVMRLANSAFYGSKGNVGTLEHAVRVLGISDFRVLVLAACAMSAIGAPPGVDMTSHWRHSAIAGQMAAAIAARRNGEGSFAFAAGLLHSVGVLIVHLTLPEEAQSVSAQADKMDLPARAAIEKDLLGFDHAEVGGELLRRWNLPHAITQAVQGYVRGDLGEQGLPSAVYCGSVSASGALRGDGIEPLLQGLCDATLCPLDVEQDWLAEQLKRSVDQASALVSAIS